MKQSLRKNRFSTLMIVSLSMIVLFQNCSWMQKPVSFGTDSNASTLRQSGNGDSYEGKPEPGLYFRSIPLSACQGSRAKDYSGKITVDDSKITLEQQSEADCEMKTSEIAFAEVEAGPRSLGLLAHKQGVFEKRNSPPRQQDLDNNFVEAWCRTAFDDQSTQRTDITISTNPVSRKTRARIIIGEKKNGRWALTEDERADISREVGGQNVAYGHGDLSLSMSTQRDGLKPLNGHFTGNIGGQVVDVPVICESAGLMDIKTSPAPPVCPADFVPVPALASYTSFGFCVAKYEARQAGVRASLDPVATPWVSLNRAQAAEACKANGSGYELIRNAEWQSVAREIERVPGNWSGGAVGTGSLNTGHSDAAPNFVLAATADDADSCFATGQSCTSGIWNSQRRTHRLSNGEFIWDFSGNVWEWMLDDSAMAFNNEGYISLMNDQPVYPSGTKALFGPAGNYVSLNSGSYGGLGYALLTANNGTIIRGGSFDERSGIFSADTWDSPAAVWPNSGFRCVFHP